MPSLFFERRTLSYEGIRLSHDDGSGVAKPVAHINGNEASFRGPVVLLNLDAHAVYGLSHPQVVSHLLKDGPQPLVSSKEMAHRLFEHGMKAALGRVKLGNNQFATSLDTFYRLEQDLAEFVLHLPTMSLIVKLPTSPAIVVCSSGYPAPKVGTGQIEVELNRILDYHKVDLP